ncbi:hypothetical protein KGQ90_16395 [Modicisalibacter tunisiensis]|uniref:hypothetical protein n=1 Tax=Modicisalibacter tunisiensis TaxID=390637 RepID=UPI001CCB12E6|nr:hypothetical protein [Modicisalibacter tunisiensis]MBZ9540500.1 hypothetical protein [Modicisalibacter tunisiensis]
MTTAPKPHALREEQRETLERLRRELDTLEARGDSDLWALNREAELLALAGADDPGKRARRLYPLPRIEGPEDRPRAEALADHLTADALRLGDPRSPEYRAGCAAYLTARIVRHALGGESGGMAPCPHTLGTAPADAWFAGVDRGRAVWETCRRLIEEPTP